MDQEFIGAIKIIDGLFLADQYAAQDLEYVVSNKVTRIINCAAKQIPNHWESIGIIYLTYPWLDNENQVIFDPRDEVLQQSYQFIEEALHQGESVIVHSVKGSNRSVALICAYFMKKYRWSLYKSLQFMHNRRPDLEIRANFFNQLLAVECRLQKLGQGAKTHDWNSINQEGGNLQEENLLRNTYLNSQGQGVGEFKDIGNKKYKPTIRWLDLDKNCQLITLKVPPYEQIKFCKQWKDFRKINQIKPSMKGSRQQQVLEQSKNEVKSQYSEQEQILVQQSRLEQPKIQSPNSIRKLNPKLESDEQQSKQSLNQIVNKQLKQKFQLASTDYLEPEKFTSSSKNNSLRNRTMKDSFNETWLKGEEKLTYGLKQGRPQTAPIQANQANFRKNRQSSNEKERKQKKRLQSPNLAYHANPYVQKQFKNKPVWRKL